MESSIWSEIITKPMGGLAAGVIALMLFIGMVPYKGKKLNETKIWKDWGLYLMFIFTTAGSFMPGVHDIPYSDWGKILIFACTTSMVALLGRGILKPVILNKLEGKKKSKE